MSISRQVKWNATTSILNIMTSNYRSEFHFCYRDRTFCSFFIILVPKEFLRHFLPLPPLFQPPIINFWKILQPSPPPPRFFKPLDYRYSRVISNPYSFLKVIYLAAIKNAIILIIYLYIKCMLANCLSISRPLKQLSKESLQCRSQEYFFGKFSANYYEFILSKIPCFSYILLNTFRRMRFKYDNYSLRGILF